MDVGALREAPLRLQCVNWPSGLMGFQDLLVGRECQEQQSRAGNIGPTVPATTGA